MPARSCAVVATWRIRLNNHETCIRSQDFHIPVEKTVATTVQSKIKRQHKSLPMYSYLKLFLYRPRTDNRLRMKSICSVTTGVALLPGPTGVMVTDSPGLQRPGRVNTEATGPVGLPGRRGNTSFNPTHAIQNFMEI